MNWDWADAQRPPGSRHTSWTLAHPDSPWDHGTSEPRVRKAGCRVEAVLKMASGFAKVSAAFCELKRRTVTALYSPRKANQQPNLELIFFFALVQYLMLHVKQQDFTIRWPFACRELSNKNPFSSQMPTARAVRRVDEPSSGLVSTSISCFPNVYFFVYAGTP